MSEEDYFKNVTEFDMSKWNADVPLHTYFREKLPNGDYFYYSEAERRALLSGPDIQINTPQGFVLDKNKLRDSLRRLSEKDTFSMRRLFDSGVHYSVFDTFNFDKINVDEVVGTFNPNSWSGLVEGMGKPTSQRTPTVDEVYNYANNILKMGPYMLRQYVQDINFSVFFTDDKIRQFFVDRNGRHRIMTFLALSDLGCEITFSNMEVNFLERRNE